MQYVIKGFIVFVSVLALMGCPANKSDSSPASGGVDGSGGDLVKVSPQVFDEFLSQKHVYFVRDIVDRLYWIKEKSPRDFENSSGLAARFLSEDKSEMYKLIESLKYVSSTEGCLSQNDGEHRITDASISGNTVCLSYAAFKNFSISDMTNKLLILTMHEISHLRGFNETEAQKWQKQFEDYQTLSATILTHKDGYDNLGKALEKISNNLGYGLMYFLNRDSEQNQLGCYSIISASEQAENILKGFGVVPGLLNEKLTNLYRLVAFLKYDCQSPAKGFEKKLVLKTVEALTQLDEINDLARTYESRFCYEYSCSQSYYDTSTPKAPLLVWYSLRDFYLHDRSYEVTPIKDIKCEIYSFKDQQTEPISFNYTQYSDGYVTGSSTVENYGDGRELTVRVSYQGINVLPMKSKGPVLIEVSYNGNEKIVKSNNFVVAGFGLLGVLQKGLHEKAEVHFALTESLKNVFNFSFETQKKSLIFPNEFRLSCAIASE